MITSMLRAIGAFLSDDKVKSVLDVLQKAATIAAIAAAGYLFLTRFEYLPRAGMSHAFLTMCIAPNLRLVRAEVRVENMGNERLYMNRLIYRWGRVLPLHPTLQSTFSQSSAVPTVEETSVNWPALFSDEANLNRWMEAGESETVYIDYFAQDWLQAVELVTWIQNEGLDGDVPSGWFERSLFEIPEAECSR